MRTHKKSASHPSHVCDKNSGLAGGIYSGESNNCSTSNIVNASDFVGTTNNQQSKSVCDFNFLFLSAVAVKIRVMLGVIGAI